MSNGYDIILLFQSVNKGTGIHPQAQSSDLFSKHLLASISVTQPAQHDIATCNVYGITNCTSHIKEVNNIRMKQKLGIVLLGIWLVMTGLLQVVSIPIPSIGIIMALLAIASGALILFER